MRQDKKKDMQIERKKQNYSYSQMTIYVQNFKQPTKELLELLNVFSTEQDTQSTLKIQSYFFTLAM